MRAALRTLLAAFVLSLALPSIAAPPNANGTANGQDNGNGAANGNSGAAGPAGEQNSPAPPAGAAEPPGPAKAPGKAEPPGQTKARAAGLPADQDAAQRAVELQQALPLAKIIKIAERRRAGKVINARLLTVSGVLLYQLTRLDDEGKSWRDYYNAATGRQVALR